MDEVNTKCFSSLLIKGVGNLSYTVSFSAIKINLQIEKKKISYSSLFYNTIRRHYSISYLKVTVLYGIITSVGITVCLDFKEI